MVLKAVSCNTFRVIQESWFGGNITADIAWFLSFRLSFEANMPPKIKQKQNKGIYTSTTEWSALVES